MKRKGGKKEGGKSHIPFFTYKGRKVKKGGERRRLSHTFTLISCSREEKRGTWKGKGKGMAVLFISTSAEKGGHEGKKNQEKKRTEKKKGGVVQFKCVVRWVGDNRECSGRVQKKRGLKEGGRERKYD